MRKSKFPEEQIIAILPGVERLMSRVDVCRRNGLGLRPKSGPLPFRVFRLFHDGGLVTPA